MTKAVEDFVKSVPLVWGLAVRLLDVPGVLRASVGVDCFVPCPPSVAPRTLNPKPEQSKVDGGLQPSREGLRGSRV